MPVMKPPSSTVESSQQQSTCAIKPSLSMTSLPPPNGQHESGELARLRIDRPYHSLKKKRDSEREIWRRSWESGHSHSSCSLHSNATNAGSGTGKDDFWAALQTNYNYIMDTNLIDSCREARGECDGSSTMQDQQVAECCEKSIFQTTKSQGSALDPRRLRRWLREMENRIEQSPSLSEAMKMKPGELQHRLTQHSDLYREIVSQARVVGACIKTAAEKETTEEAAAPEKTTTSPGSASSRRSDGNLKGLERRYHLLYLKAFEVQCMLESLLGRRGSPSPDISRSQSDTDEEPVAKQARLSSLSSICGFESRRCLYQDNDDIRSDDEWGNPLAQAAGFEADSEGSDCEVTPKPAISSLSSNSNSGTPFSSLTLPDLHHQQTSHQSQSQMPEATAVVDAAAGTMDIGVDVVDAGEMTKSLVTQVIVTPASPETPKSITKSPQKRSRKVDISKFNRSNRKSKNCAIFYFRHLDTDGEQKGFSSQGSEAFKSSEPSTDEEWYYTNNGAADDENNEASNHHHVDDEPNHTLINSSDDPLVNDTTVEAKQDDVVTPVAVESSTKRALKCSKESIHQLVLDAENLIREETTKKSCSALAEVMLMSSTSSSRRKCEKKMMHNPKIKRVQEWLEHQPIDAATNPPSSVPTTDCEASGEYTESDREITARDSDTSEGLADSVATCLQGGEANSNSQATSTEVIGGSAEPLPTGQIDAVSPGSVSTAGRVVMRGKRRNSDRPWSVSSLSQLTQTMSKRTHSVVINNQLATFSISESALHTLSTPLTPGGPATSSIGNSDSKSSLRKHRRLRMKKRSIGRKSDSGSDGAPQQICAKSLVKSESFSGQSNFVQEQLSLLTISRRVRQTKSTSSEMESEEDGLSSLAKPAFRLGSVTNVFPSTTLAPNLGSLAALANYNGACLEMLKTQTSEDLSSEQAAWDNYQEKYNSENYSEGLDSDAARRLLEFGDDYRNFLDSQSDCCSSSLSAANNIDSLSPPRYRKQLFSSPDCKSPAVPDTSAHASESNSIRRRRALEYAEYERRRRRYSDDRRKSFESSSSRLSPKNGGSADGGVIRRKHSESDSSAKRRSGGRLSGSFRPLSSTSGSSSCGSDSEAELEIKNLLSQSRQRLEHTEALRVRRHLLRPEDYAEIIATCRDNVHCLEAVLRGPGVTVLSTTRCQETRELLSSWESLLNWSETASVARQLQEEMSVLKAALHRIGNQAILLDSEASIQDAIEELKEEKAKLLGHRSTMLKLNSSVHSWLTRQEFEMSKYSSQSHILGSVTLVDSTDGSVDMERTMSCSESEKDKSQFFDTELHALLKDNVSDMYSVWDEADHRINLQLESLMSSLQAWQQLESGLVEFQEALGKDKGALKGLRGALESGRTTPVDLAHDVKEVAKLLSEKVEMTLQNKLQSESIFLHPSTAILYHGKSSSNGSLSDSGISDGGCGSDGGLSERERRLGTLRRLAKQLESALAPGSAALRSIFQRMEAAESELKQLQDTCRELIVRTTTVTHRVPSNGGSSEESEGHNKSNGVEKKKTTQSKKKNKRRSPQNSVVEKVSLEKRDVTAALENTSGLAKNRRPVIVTTVAAADGDPDDPDSGASGCLDEEDDDGDGKKHTWAWRVAKIAIPVQIALVSLFCAACFLEPHCCDALNNFSMSFSPQLKYIRGPPPI